MADIDAKRCKKYVILDGIIWLFLLTELSAYLTTGYFGDDILNSSIRGECLNRSCHLIQMIGYYLKEAVQDGRCNFISWTLQYMIHYFVTNRKVYKCLIIVCTMLSVKVAQKFISFHFDDQTAGRIFLYVVAVFFPLYFSGSSSLMMYWGFMQLEVILLFSCLFFLEKYLADNMGRNLICSVIIFSCSLFVYEISFIYIFFIAAVFKTKHRNNKNRGKELLYFAIPFGIGLLINIVCKIVSENSQRIYDGVSVSLDLGKTVKTFLIQWSGGIPFYHYAMELMTGKNFLDLLKQNTMFLISGVAFSGILLTIFLKAYRKENETVILFTGFMLWFGSAAFIGITQKYQREILQSYYPHIPAYLEFFGLMMLIFLLCYRLFLSKRISAKYKKAAVVILCLTGCLNHFFGNVCKLNFCRETEAMYVEIPDAYAQAIKAGLFDKIQQEDTVLIDISYVPTIFDNYFAQCAGRPVHAQRIDAFLADIKETEIKDGIYEPDHNVYITKHFQNDDSIVVYLDRILCIEFDENMNQTNSITVSSISSWCKSQNEISALVLNGQNHTDVLNIEACAVEQKGMNEYLITTPEGRFDYYSYTFWQ